MKILIYGSTFLTECVCNFISNYHDIVAYIPSENPSFPGNLKYKLFSGEYFDFAISIQYDKKILDTSNTYNLHTGILPEYGGCDILYHTIKNKEKYQGLTFHKITEKLDFGPIISIIKYPVLEQDTIVDLYSKILILAPAFVLSCIDLLKIIDVDLCPSYKPIKYKRGNIDQIDIENYKKTYLDLLNLIKNWNIRQYE